jgi:Ser/Thr protein kinase RdoA (MazF antagonist)
VAQVGGLTSAVGRRCAGDHRSGGSNQPNGGGHIGAARAGCAIIGAVATAEQVRTVLRTTWQRLAGECVPLPAGITATNWAVMVNAEPFTVKIVPAGQRGAFEAGLAVAEYLQGQQSPAATGVRAVDGGLVGPLGDEVAALLRHVPGRPLDGTDPVDRQWWGDALGSAHRRLSGFRHPTMATFHSVRSEAAHLGVAGWVRPAVAAAVAAVRRLTVTDQLTYGVLHGDPAPAAFRLDPQTGRLGLVDWGPVASGPLMYDLAAAVLYAGGAGQAKDLIDAYLAAGPVPLEEVEAALPTMLLFRWAVYADHHARRLSAARSGPASPAGGTDDDVHGLDRARDALADLLRDLPP